MKMHKACFKQSTLVRLLLFLCLFLSTTIFMTACSGDAPSHGTTTTETTATFHDPKLSLMAPLTEGGGGMFSWFLDLIGEGLKEGITVWIGEKTTGRVLDIIANKIMGGGSEESSALSEMNSKMGQMEKQLEAIGDQITNLANQLSIDITILLNYTDHGTLKTYITPITARWDSGDSSGYMYFSREGDKLGKMDTNDPGYANKAAALKSQAETYYSDNRINMDIKTAIQGIHDAIVPSAQTKGVLIDYANKIILTNQFKGSDSDKATQCYSLLESFFSQLLTYQTKAYIMVMEVDNYNDTLSGGDNAAQFREYYAGLLNDEVDQFRLAVNHLMLNLIDYRTSEKYQEDAKYIHKQGLAQDNTYNHLFARSRFFSRQIMKNFDDVLVEHPLPNNMGLYGAIVTPLHYSPGADSPVTEITLKFSGPITFTKKIQASAMKARFPNTKWDSKNRTSGPDYDWSFYDMDFSADDYPAGIYKITLEDKGNKNVPWYHTATDLGTVSILYYNPRTADSTTATTAPTATNTVKFGSFSGRWDWGYNLLSLSPMTDWSVPATTTYTEYNAYGKKFTTTSENPYMYHDDGSFSGNYSYYPHKGSSIETVHNFGWQLTSHKFGRDSTDYTAYEIRTPFSVGTSDAATSGVVTLKAGLFYAISGNMVFNASENSDWFGAKTRTHLFYDFILHDGSTTLTVNNYSSSSTLRSINQSIAKSGILSESLESGKTYSLGVDSGFNSYTMHQNTQSGKVDLNWDMQVVYKDTLDLVGL